MDEAYLSFRRVLSILVKLAEVETSVYRLAVQIRKTHRRVNALEKVVIPTGRAEADFINSVLEEGDREDFVRMKIAKQNREKKV
jgi:V/A-type H+-transporting ATPase subunit D